MKLALDIGGTYIRWEMANGIKGKERLDKIDLQTFIQDLIKKGKITHMGISYAGQVFRNEILSAPNIHATFDPKKMGIPYVIENDLKCAVLAEAQFFNASCITALYSGTGLGSATIDQNRIVRGFRNLAGEIGHIPYKKAPFRCGCGKDNCIELFASGSGLQKWANYLKTEATLKNKVLYALYTEALLYATATVLTLFNPSVLVLGGGVIKNSPDIIGVIQEKIESFSPPFSLKDVQIKLTQLEDASLEGIKILLERLP
ncbi:MULTISPECIES: ROK family protein [unclassified Nitratiruptor]|uniref:ROK family protein n=1 Tax=unclassified Nitratiruptor TaxID=2624044 RepID=UPI0019163F99|nr:MULTISPECIES: ROK family protein [unclassified Nitratiruptor]BCD60345.1 glucokinase [Nitratiruptor sp. YY08-10]BCD64166.1 glucokinase [Nitratiruptor sp. YY08-14]